MDLIVFKEKMAQIDKRFYVADDNRKFISGEFYQVPLYIKIQKNDPIKSNLSQLSKEAADFLAGKEGGHFDEHVCGVPWPWVPEFDVFDLDTGREIARGWRTIARSIIAKKLAPAHKVRRAFGQSIGTTDYDRLSFEAKKDLSKKDAK